jgi:hypothetical protein
VGPRGIDAAHHARARLRGQQHDTGLKESPMRRRNTRGYLALSTWILASAWLTGCASTPPSRSATPQIRELREDYLAEFPNGPNNDHIKRGEIVRGMSLFEVLASWGIPDARVVATEGNRERWIYVLLDDLSLDWVGYEYEFHGNELVDWSTTKNVRNGLPLDTPDLRRSPLTLPAWANQTGVPQR